MQRSVLALSFLSRARSMSDLSALKVIFFRTIIVYTKLVLTAGMVSKNELFHRRLLGATLDEHAKTWGRIGS